MRKKEKEKDREEDEKDKEKEGGEGEGEGKRAERNEGGGRKEDTTLNFCQSHNLELLWTDFKGEGKQG